MSRPESELQSAKDALVADGLKLKADEKSIWLRYEPWACLGAGVIAGFALAAIAYHFGRWL